MLDCLLRVGALVLEAHLIQGGTQRRVHELARRSEPAVEIDRAEHRLVQVREHRARQRALAQTGTDARAALEIEEARRFRQRPARHDPRLELREVALREMRVMAEELLRDDQVECRVAQELEALVVAIEPHRRVRERELLELDVLEVVRQSVHAARP